MYHTIALLKTWLGNFRVNRGITLTSWVCAVILSRGTAHQGLPRAGENLLSFFHDLQCNTMASLRVASLSTLGVSVSVLLPGQAFALVSGTGKALPQMLKFLLHLKFLLLYKFPCRATWLHLRSAKNSTNSLRILHRYIEWDRLTDAICFSLFRMVLLKTSASRESEQIYRAPVYRCVDVVSAVSAVRYVGTMCSREPYW